MTESIALILATLACFLAVRSGRRSKRLEKQVQSLERHLPGASNAHLGLVEKAVDEAENDVVEPKGNTAQVDSEVTRKTAGLWDRNPGGPFERETPEQPSIFAGLGAWIRLNWIYPVAGAALVMAAVYLVQYSVEHDLLSPRTRIALALLLGAALIGTGEAIRRRWGDEGGAARLLPSTFSGAGIVTLMAAILAAFHIFGMMSQVSAFAALSVIVGLAMVLGWVHGPLLAAIGVLAGSAAPFLLGESSAPKDLLYGYFGLIALLGMGIDGFKRWGWVSLLAVIMPIVASGMIYQAGAGPYGFAALALAVAFLATSLPSGTLIPSAAGPRISQFQTERPSIETFVSGLAVLMASGAILSLREPSLILAALGVLVVIMPVWTARAPALLDQVLVPVLGFLLAILIVYLDGQGVVGNALIKHPWLPFVGVAVASLSGLALIWRSQKDTQALRSYWTLLGIGFPGASFVAFELFWSISTRIEPWPWALTAMALASAAAAVALWAAKLDAGQGVRVGAATAAGFAMIGMSLTVMLSFSALTLALAVLMVASAAMDRRFDIPILGWFQAAAATALIWRIVLDPGLDWLLGWAGSGGATDGEVALSITAALIGPLAALWLIAPMPQGRMRTWTRVYLETVLTGLVPVCLAIGVVRFIGQDISVHAHLGLQVTVLIGLGWIQMQRAHSLDEPSVLQQLRRVVAGALAVLSVGLLVLTTTLATPLSSDPWLADSVRGVAIANDLLVAYALPGALLLWLLRTRVQRWAVFGRAVGYLLLAYWIGCVIRHLWHGNAGMALTEGFLQGEIYAYTVALLAAGAGALALALRLGRSRLRVVGLVLIGMAAGKAFLIDASGLSGLLRVSAFLGLGISLAGLAWLNAWVTARMSGAPGSQ